MSNEEEYNVGKARRKLEIDTKNPEELKQFFIDHKEYKPYEIALKYNIPVSTVRYWKKKYSPIKEEPSRHEKIFQKRKFKKKKKTKPKYDKSICTKEWLEQKYVNEGLSMRQISSLVGVTATYIFMLIKSAGIQTRSQQEAQKSKNKYYNKEWLIEHYLVNNMTIEEISKIAKVNKYTISNWLVSFGIMPRDKQSSIVKRHYKKQNK
jgi:transposase